MVSSAQVVDFLAAHVGPVESDLTDYRLFARADGSVLVTTSGLVDRQAQEPDPLEVVYTSERMSEAAASYLLGLTAHVVKGSPEGALSAILIGDDEPLLDPEFSTACALLLVDADQLGPLQEDQGLPAPEGFRFLHGIPVLVEELAFFAPAVPGEPVAKEKVSGFTQALSGAPHRARDLRRQAVV